jgi:hypothetical protein
MLTYTGARGLVHDAAMAFDETNRLIGYRLNTQFNLHDDTFSARRSRESR